MKNKIILSVILLSFAVLSAKPAFMGGITLKFNDNISAENLGTTIKILSSDKDKKAVVSAGASYYPWAKKDKQFGLDLGLGYNVKKVNIMAGWDFIANQPAVSLGYATSVSDSTDNKEVIDDETIKSCKNKDK